MQKLAKVAQEAAEIAWFIAGICISLSVAGFCIFGLYKWYKFCIW